MPENDIKLLKLEDLIDITTQYIKGEITNEELSEFGNKMIIRNYIPIQEKMGMVMGLMISYKFSDLSSQEIKVGELHRALFFYVILAGYGMIDCSNVELITYENYDLLYPIFSPFILSYCKDDYDLFKEFVHDTINMYTIMDMVDFFNNLDIEELKNASEENRRILEEFEENRESIKDLKDIIDMNDPTTAKIVKELKNVAREKAMVDK